MSGSFSNQKPYSPKESFGQSFSIQRTRHPADDKFTGLKIKGRKIDTLIIET